MTHQEYITIKEYTDKRFDELDKRLAVQFELNDRALIKAAETNEARLEHLNEFRAQMQEERDSFARKEEVEYRISQLEKNAAFGTGKTAGKEWMIGVGVAIVIALVAIFT